MMVKNSDGKDNEFCSISVRTTKKNFKIIHNRIESSQFNSDVARSSLLMKSYLRKRRMASATQTKKTP